jgi:hypothetical protein
MQFEKKKSVVPVLPAVVEIPDPLPELRRDVL